jgi:hypothetical protein
VVCILAQKWLTLFFRVINQVIGAHRLGHVGKDHGGSACWWGCSGSWGSVLQCNNLHLERVDDGHELGSGWSGSGHTCLMLSNGDYGCGWLKLLGAFLNARNLSKRDTSG